MNRNVVLYDNEKCEIAESPLWDEKNCVFYYIDMLGKKVIKIFENHSKEIFFMPQIIGTIALDEEGGLIAAMEDGIYRCKKEALIPICIPKELHGLRFNDGKIGPDGAFYVGTFSTASEGAFYRLAGKTFQKLLSGVGISNGLCWSQDAKLLYYIDSRKRRLYCLGMNHDGTVKSSEIISDFSNMQGDPDGMTIDAQGCLWIAMWGGGEVVQIAPETGEVLQRIGLPVSKVSSCIFGGKELKTLFITTAKTQGEPLSGAVFSVELSIPGLYGSRYRAF